MRSDGIGNGMRNEKTHRNPPGIVKAGIKHGNIKASICKNRNCKSANLALIEKPEYNKN